VSILFGKSSDGMPRRVLPSHFFSLFFTPTVLNQVQIHSEDPGQINFMAENTEFRTLLEVREFKIDGLEYKPLRIIQTTLQIDIPKTLSWLGTRKRSNTWETLVLVLVNYDGP